MWVAELLEAGGGNGFRRGLLVSHTLYYFTNTVGYFAQVSI